MDNVVRLSVVVMLLEKRSVKGVAHLQVDSPTSNTENRDLFHLSRVIVTLAPNYLLQRKGKKGYLDCDGHDGKVLLKVADFCFSQMRVGHYDVMNHYRSPPEGYDGDGMASFGVVADLNGALITASGGLV